MMLLNTYKTNKWIEENSKENQAIKVRNLNIANK